MNEDLKETNSAMHYAGLATQWMIMLGLAVWGGLKLDKMTGWKVPLFLILLPLLALGVSLWQLIRSLNQPKK